MPTKKNASEETTFDSFVKEVAGTDGLRIVKSISGDGATDEVIEKATKLKLAQIRSFLNQLHNYGIVEYNREKNMTSGWFTYTWRVNRSRAMQNFLLMKRREYHALKSQLERDGEGALVYECPKGCGKTRFDVAMDNAFACAKCSGKLKPVDASKELETLEKKVGALERLVTIPNGFGHVAPPMQPPGAKGPV